jgi:cytochrome oxidase Cu insertion factor (SCO1/SenC/PrrC family)
MTGQSIGTMAGIAGLLLGLAGAQNPGKPADAEHTGLAVGTAAPKFTLEDQTGTPRSLDALLEKGPVALVFYRSASW